MTLNRWVVLLIGGFLAVSIPADAAASQAKAPPGPSLGKLLQDTDKNNKDDGDKNNKDDGQKNDKDDGQKNNKDDGQKNDKDDGQKNNKDDGDKGTKSGDTPDKKTAPASTDKKTDIEKQIEQLLKQIEELRKQLPKK